MNETTLKLNPDERQELLDALKVAEVRAKAKSGDSASLWMYDAQTLERKPAKDWRRKAETLASLRKRLEK